MSKSSDPVLQAITDELEKAWEADVPNIAVIRACKDKMVQYLAKCVIELMEAPYLAPPARRCSFRVICNDSPRRSTDRQISSPVKTPEILEFEEQAQRIFGVSAACTTAWTCADNQSD